MKKLERISIEKMKPYRMNDMTNIIGGASAKFCSEATGSSGEYPCGDSTKSGYTDDGKCLYYQTIASGQECT